MTAGLTHRTGVDDKAAHAVECAREHLFSLQHADGWWKGELETNVTMDAEDLLLREFLGVRDENIVAASARWIRSQQRTDGTWANFRGGPADLSTTVEAYTALRLAGDRLDAEHMRIARDFVLDNGGIEHTRVFTKIWLALFGEWPWERLPVLPPEMVLLPSWFPLNIYDWASWARQTVVPLTLVSAQRPVRPLRVSVQELRTGAATPPAASLASWDGVFERLDQALRLHEHMPLKPLRGLATQRAERWILRRQEADGCWGGIQPPWVYSMIALNILGYGAEHPVMRRALSGLDGFSVWEQTSEGMVRRLEACQSPVWDTVLALNALRDANSPADDPALLRAAEWVLGEEITVRGDWAVRRPRVRPSGWAFEFANDTNADTDDTSEVVLAFSKLSSPPGDGRIAAAMDRATEWLDGMQSASGGWGAFDADNTRTLCEKVPFSDFGAVIDPPSADVTAHIVEMYAAQGKANTRAARRGIRWLLRHQEQDGSWYGRWGANHLYGTGAAVPALCAAGISPHDRVIRRAVDWVLAHQNADGGWGEDLRSYEDSEWVGRGTSTASQTAWALYTLVAAGELGTATRRGVEWLVSRQREDGTWDEPQFTGTGFPGDFYINYHLYRLVFPLSALGRYLEGSDGGSG